MNTLHHSIWGRFVIDSRTGLPILDENQFWKVTRPWGTGYVGVSLREKTWYGSRKIKSHPISKNKVSQKTILDAAEYILFRKPEKNNTQWKSYLGTYPPKSLGTP